MTFGIILLIIGVVFLLKNLGLISGGVWNIIWPCLLIAIGLRFLFKRKGSPWWCNWQRWREWHKRDEEWHRKFHEKEEKKQQKRAMKMSKTQRLRWRACPHINKIGRGAFKISKTRQKDVIYFYLCLHFAGLSNGVKIC